MLRPVDNWFLQHEEPVKSCLAFLRDHILKYSVAVTETWRYGMPFYNYHGKRFCYLWVHKKFHQPYIGIVDGNKVVHPDLMKESRTRMKILLVDPLTDIPIAKLDEILHRVISLYK